MPCVLTVESRGLLEEEGLLDEEEDAVPLPLPSVFPAPVKKETVAREVDEIELRTGCDLPKVVAAQMGNPIAVSGITAKMEYPECVISFEPRLLRAR